MSFYDEIKELRLQYLESLINEIDQHLSSLSYDKLPSDKLRDFAHRIKGSGASYGFDFITNKGSMISEMVKAFKKVDEIKKVLLSLREECDASLKSIKLQGDKNG